MLNIMIKSALKHASRVSVALAAIILYAHASAKVWLLVDAIGHDASSGLDAQCTAGNLDGDGDFGLARAHEEYWIRGSS
jgi:hypothetical protein